MERCGLDPLQGDEDLVTPWDIVRETFGEQKSEIEDYLEEKYKHSYEDRQSYVLCVDPRCPSRNIL